MLPGGAKPDHTKVSTQAAPWQDSGVSLKHSILPESMEGALILAQEYNSIEGDSQQAKDKRKRVMMKLESYPRYVSGIHVIEKGKEFVRYAFDHEGVCIGIQLYNKGKEREGVVPEGLCVQDVREALIESGYISKSDTF